MIVDLNPLPYKMALDLIKFCIERNIDREKCVELLEACRMSPPPSNIEWTLDVPEKYISWFLMKWA